jgi:hypothetical protein
VRVRDVEIALVLAREMKDAAARDVEASLRLEQLKEVFGAADLDAGERARIQTALQMAGLEPSPSLLEADPSAPIRFTVTGEEAPAPVPAASVEAPAEERPEFPTVGEFFGRFRRKKRRGEDTVDADAGEPVVEDADADAGVEEPEVEEQPEPEPLNGHVEVETNGHHVDLLDEVALPPHDTATPSDFGASAETIDFDDPRVEEELFYADEEEWEDEEESEDAEEDADTDADAGELELEPEFEFDAEPEPEPEPAPVVAEEPAPAGARVEELAALLVPLVAVPVLIASLAGWTFGLPFVALSLIATGFLAGRRAGFLSTLRSSAAARTILKATLLVTAASAAVAIVLANVGSGDGGADEPRQPATKKPAATPAPAPEKPKAEKPKAKPKPEKPKAKTETTPQSSPPDDGTQGLFKAPPATSNGGTSTQPQGQTGTTPVPQTQQP